MKTLSFKETVLDALSIGLKNAVPVLGAVALWLITIWIPYINVGTTIAISMLPTQLAEGKLINPLSIFDSQYRRYMGEYLLTQALMVIGILLGCLFLIVPGVVLSYAWSLAIFFLIAKGKNPMAAIKASNDATYGSKWTIFGIAVTVGVIFFIINLLISGIFTVLNLLLIKADLYGMLGVTALISNILSLIIFVINYSINLAVMGSVWRQLKDNVE